MSSCSSVAAELLLSKAQRTWSTVGIRYIDEGQTCLEGDLAEKNRQWRLEWMFSPTIGRCIASSDPKRFSKNADNITMLYFQSCKVSLMLAEFLCT
jgi:hypothetical protein